MLISPVSVGVYPNNKKNLKKEPAFKSRLTYDVGGSDPRASLKILVQNNKGKDLFEYTGFVNDTTAGFQNNEDFVSKIAKSADVGGLLESDISSIEKQLSANHLMEEEAEKMRQKLAELKANSAIWNGRSAAEKKLTGLSVLLPGTIQGDKAVFLPNIKRIDKKAKSGLVRLTNVNLKAIVEKIKTQGKVEVSPELNFMTAKDLAGTALGVMQKGLNEPEYAKRMTRGFRATIVQTGGGFGAVDVDMQTDNFINIATNESGHDLYMRNLSGNVVEQYNNVNSAAEALKNMPKKPKGFVEYINKLTDSLNVINQELANKKLGTQVRLGKMGVSVGCVIENFAEKLNIKNPKDINALQKTGLGQLATQPQIKFNNQKDAAAIEVLKKSGFYEVLNEGSYSTTLKIKPGNMKEFNEASKHAISSYAEGLAKFAITKITYGRNMFILSGPLAMGLNNSIKQNPDVYGAKDMRSLIFQYIDKSDEMDSTRVDLANKNKFDIVCDKRLSVNNNTSGGAMLLAGKVETNSRHGELMGIEKAVLKGSKKIIKAVV